MRLTTDGWWQGLVGVLIFSGSLPTHDTYSGRQLRAAIPDVGPGDDRGPSPGGAAWAAATKTTAGVGPAIAGHRGARRGGRVAQTRAAFKRSPRRRARRRAGEEHDV